MAGTISMAGLASGMDVSGMIDALVNANGIQMKNMQSRVTETQAASSDISSIGSLLAKLQTSVSALSDTSNIQGFVASSSDTAVQTSVTGAASGGLYSVEVKALAQEYRAYSNPVDDANAALNQTGPMAIQVGADKFQSFSINATDSLNSIAKQINQANIGVQATTFYDGSQFRLQLRGTDSGVGNEVTISGLDFGLNTAANIKQQPQDAHLVIDGYDVYSKSNQITGAIPGVTLSATKLTTSAATVEIKADPTSLKTKLQGVVSAYNAVIAKVHSVAGYSGAAASDAMLAGDSTLRQLTTKMSDTIMSVVDTGTQYGTLNSLGVSLNRDGTLDFDDSKLTKALSTNPDAVVKVLAGSSDASTNGVMDIMKNVVDMFNRTGDGLLVNKTNTYTASIKRLNDSVTAEQTRLDNYRTLLEKQFQAMSDAMSTANSTTAYLNAIAGTNSSSSSSSSSGNSSSG
jgi:flagellar hook-associated protein 2